MQPPAGTRRGWYVSIVSTLRGKWDVVSDLRQRKKKKKNGKIAGMIEVWLVMSGNWRTLRRAGVSSLECGELVYTV